MEKKRVELRASIKANQTEVWPEHWRAAQLFFAMATQWNAIATISGTRYLGLRYEALDSVEKRLPPLSDSDPMPAIVFAQFQELERCAKEHINSD